MLVRIQDAPGEILIETSHISSITQDPDDNKYYSITLSNSSIFHNITKYVIRRILKNENIKIL